MNSADHIRNYRQIILSWVILCFSYIVSLGIPFLFLPIPEDFKANLPRNGLIPGPFDLVFNSVVCSTLVLWLVKRSAYSGHKLFLQVFLPLFFVQTFQTQIETAYFIDAFKLLKGNFEVYLLFLRGAVSSAIFAGITLLIKNKIIKHSLPDARFDVPTDRIIKKSLWLGFVYFVLYLLFGYFVAWQSSHVRAFYGGPEKLNSFFDQIRIFLIDKPELPFFQYCRGLLWILSLIPIFKGFTGSRNELLILSALFLGLIPTAQLVYPNPLMPNEVSAFHFAEVAISNGIFGILTALLIPVKKRRTETASD